MKYINKFISVGLGFALTFTGTNFVQGMFTSNARQENVVTIPKKGISVDTNKYVYFYDYKQNYTDYDGSNKDHREDPLYIPIEFISEDVTIDKLSASVTRENTNETSGVKDVRIVESGPHNNECKNGSIVINPSDKGQRYIRLILKENMNFSKNETYNVVLNFKIPNTQTIKYVYKIKAEDNCTETNNIVHKNKGESLKHIEIISQSQSIINNLSESKLLEQLNEKEVLIESQDEDMELSSETDVVELPQVEEPSESNLLEQPNEEIQEVLPSQTDIIVERKEETEIEE